MTKKGIDVTVVEQLLKEMENLKIAMAKKFRKTVPQTPSISIVGAYGAIAPNMIRRIVMSTRRLYGKLSSTMREIGSIQWTLGRHSS